MTQLQAESAHALAARDIVSVRRFDLPRERIFAAFADPARLARWWGPSGFRNTFHEFDFRPGGHWRFTMHGPDGVDYPNHSVFAVIDAPARIVLDHRSGPRFEMTMSLDEEGAQTRLTWHMRFETAEMRDAVARFAVQANEQNFDRLQADLATID